MKTKIIVIVLLLLSASACAIDIEDSIIDNATNKVRTITFSGDNVTLTYTDNSSVTVDMDSVIVSLGASSGLKVQKMDNRIIEPSYYDMRGTMIEQEPGNGIFIIKKGYRCIKISK